VVCKILKQKRHAVNSMPLRVNIFSGLYNGLIHSLIIRAAPRPDI